MTPAAPPPETADEALRAELPFHELIRRPAIRELLERERARQMDKPPAFQIRPGAKTSFRGETYDLVEHLGQGGFGTVYRVRDARGQEFAIKFYHRNAHAGAHLAADQAELVKWSQRGVPTVVDGGYEVDGVALAVRYPYLHGLPLADLWNAPALPPALRQRLSSEYQAWFAEQQKKAPVRNKTNDIVLDFPTGRFVYVDRG